MSAVPLSKCFPGDPAHYYLSDSVALGKIKPTLQYFDQSRFHLFDLMERMMLPVNEAVAVMERLVELELVQSADDTTLYRLGSPGYAREAWATVANFAMGIPAYMLSVKGMHFASHFNSTPKPIKQAEMVQLLDGLLIELIRHNFGNLAKHIYICSSRSLESASTYDIFPVIDINSMAGDTVKAANRVVDKAMQGLRRMTYTSICPVIVADTDMAAIKINLADKVDGEWLVKVGHRNNLPCWLNLYDLSSSHLSGNIERFYTPLIAHQVNDNFPIANVPQTSEASSQTVDQGLVAHMYDTYDRRQRWSIIAMLNELFCTQPEGFDQINWDALYLSLLRHSLRSCPLPGVLDEKERLCALARCWPEIVSEFRSGQEELKKAGKKKTVINNYVTIICTIDKLNTDYMIARIPVSQSRGTETAFRSMHDSMRVMLENLNLPHVSAEGFLRHRLSTEEEITFFNKAITTKSYKYLYCIRGTLYKSNKRYTYTREEVAMTPIRVQAEPDERYPLKHLYYDAYLTEEQVSYLPKLLAKHYRDYGITEEQASLCRGFSVQDIITNDDNRRMFSRTDMMCEWNITSFTPWAFILQYGFTLLGMEFNHKGGAILFNGEFITQISFPEKNPWVRDWGNLFHRVKDIIVDTRFNESSDPEEVKTYIEQYVDFMHLYVTDDPESLQSDIE